MRRQNTCLSVLGVLNLYLCATEANADMPLDISVNTSNTTGPLDFLYGVDHGPLCDSGVDVTTQLQSFGSSLIRTHDSGVLDWPVIFPHPNLDVSTSDPKNYNFGPGDAYFKSIIDSGTSAHSVRIHRDFCVYVVAKDEVWY